MKDNLHKKLYDIEKFDKHKNFYTIIKKNYPIIKRYYNKEDIILDDYIENETLFIIRNVVNDKNKKYILFANKTKFLPVYGHFESPDNLFVYVLLDRKTMQPKYNEFYKCKREDLVKANNLTVFNYYNWVDLKDLNDIIAILREEELKNREWIEDKDNYHKIYGEFYEYIREQEVLIENVDPENIEIYLYGEKQDSGEFVISI